MKETYIGELQELILLTIMANDNRAYGVIIQEDLKNSLGRKLSRGSLHTALSRLESKGFLVSELGEPTPERGGKSKKYYSVTSEGKRVIALAKELRERYYRVITEFSFHGAK